MSKTPEKKGLMLVIGEIWAWVAMFILIVIFAMLILLPGCAPKISELGAAQLSQLQGRQDVLGILQSTALFHGQNMTVAEAIVFGQDPKLMPELSAVLQKAIVDAGREPFMSAVRISYPQFQTDKIVKAHTIAIGTPNEEVLDTIVLPGRAPGEPIRVVFSRQRSTQNQQARYTQAKETGAPFVTKDGVVFVYWSDGQFQNSWS